MRSKLLYGLGVVALSILPAAVQAQTVGNAVAVVPAVKGAARTLQSGDSVFYKEVIQAYASGETKLEFLDKTVLTVGSGSLVTLDRFLYDPNSGRAREFTLNMTKGAFRFVTGVSDKQAYELKTPTATMGVRGTNVLVVVKNGMTSLRVDDGEVVVCNKKAPPGAVHRDPPGEDCRAVPTGSGTTVTSTGSFTEVPIGIEGVNPGALIQAAGLDVAPATGGLAAGGLTAPLVIGAGVVGGVSAAAASGAFGGSNTTPMSP